MPLGNLTAQRQPYPGPPRLGSKKWNKQIARIENSRPFVADKYFGAIAEQPPTRNHIALGFERSVNSIVKNVD